MITQYMLRVQPMNKQTSVHLSFSYLIIVYHYYECKFLC